MTLLILYKEMPISNVVLSPFRVLLQRFDAETCDDEETSNENSETTSFITQLATWQKQVEYYRLQK